MKIGEIERIGERIPEPVWLPPPPRAPAAPTPPPQKIREDEREDVPA